MRLFATLPTLGFAGLLLAGCTINGNPFDFTGTGDGDGVLIECVAANATAGQLAGLTEREALDRAIALCLGEEGVPPEDCYEEAFAACVAEYGGLDGEIDGDTDPDGGNTICIDVAREACDEEPTDPECFDVELNLCVNEGGDPDWCGQYAAEICGDGGGGEPTCEENAFAVCQDEGLDEEACLAYVAETCGDGGGSGPTCEEEIREACALNDLDEEACNLWLIEACPVDPDGIE